MIKYRNISLSAKTFYGITFEPGEVKSVPGYINNPGVASVFPTNKHNSERINSSVTPNYVSPKRGRRKSNDTDKTTLAETETKIDTQEETTDGNPS